MPAPSRPPGVYDRPPQEAAEAAAVCAELTHVLGRFGYQSVETPLIEYADLFLTKSGDEAINRLFTFELYGRQLCLRSEFTVSAARLYVERFQHEPKPIRWQFAGPVFRYESRGRGHSRQFSMVGTELIGPSGSAGDAETIGMAVRGLLALQLADWKLVIGHVGLVSQLLDRYEIDRRTRRLLLGQIENLRRPGRGRAYVEQQYEQMIALGAAPERTPGHAAVLEEAVRKGLEANVASALELLLESANLGTTGTGRTNEDVARRLLTKQQRAEQRGQVNAALDFLEQLTAIQATPSEAFPALERLLPDDPEVLTTFREFRTSVDLLEAYGINSVQTELHMGLARGLNYYTGLVFEIHSIEGDQLCGGGRYDDFIRLIGAAQDTPAVGFVFMLDRVIAEARKAGFSAPPKTASVLVVPVEEADNADAARVAVTLRDLIAAELYTPPTRNLAQAISYASRRGLDYVIIVGERERAAHSVTVRDLHAESQRMVGMADLPRFLAEVAHEAGGFWTSQQRGIG